ncbi:MAG TPA: SpoIID/LytB domain-containing protein [Vicinamibacterales bacterium]|nr:SpoIID/LytB domain-containing protein [Vicinamibacterales bacterium]
MARTPNRGWVFHPARSAGVVAIALLAASACAPSKGGFPGPLAATYRVPDRVNVRVAGKVTSVPLDEYVLGAVLAEVTPLDETDLTVARIFEAQSIVARTYAVSQIGRHRQDGFDLCDTTHCQLYQPARIASSRFSAAARAAVTRTSGRVLLYGGRIVEALFHADCGGATTSADAVWGGPPLPYLRSVIDALPPETHRPWQVAISVEQLRQALDADPRTDVGRTLATIDVVSRDESGRAAELTVRGAHTYTVRGDVLRSVINQKLGDKAVQSTRFSVTKSAGMFTFKGTGYGHGVGMCQRGAMARARQGQPVDQILRTYYPGAAISRSGS